MTKGELAQKYFKEGYNCSQSVVLAFAPELGIDEKTLCCLSSSFGGGFGRMREVCGAVSGMAIVSGFKFGYYSPDNLDEKAANYRQIQELINDFKQKNNGKFICRELLGLNISQDSPIPEKRTPEYYKKRPCSEIVKIAADIVWNRLFSN